MAALPFMPLYVADYLADSAHLSTTGHGAYLLLIMTYWQRGEPLPDDDRKLARIARLTDPEWEEIKGDIRDFFTPQDGRLTHGRIDRELENVSVKSDKKRASAEKRWGKVKENAGSGADEMQTKCERIPDAIQVQCHTDTDTDTDTEKGEGNTPSPQKAEKPEIPDEALEIAQELEKLHRETLDPGFHPPASHIRSWAADIEKLNRIDRRGWDDIREALSWAKRPGCFWGPNILSGKTFRQKFPTIWAQMSKDRRPAAAGTGFKFSM